MRKNPFVSLLLFTFGASLFFSCQQKQKRDYKPTDFTPAIAAEVRDQVMAFEAFVSDSLQPAIDHADHDYEHLKAAFLKTRLYYKRFEWAAEYFVGTTAAFINGPADQEVDNADLLSAEYARGLAPSGLQVMEELIFPDASAFDRQNLQKEVAELQDNAQVLRQYFTSRTLADWRVLDALKLEVFRILTLGITGFDNELTLNSMQESAVSLQSLQKALKHFQQTDQDAQLLHRIEKGIQVLQNNKDFDRFDRADFILHYGNPISRGIAQMEKRYEYPLQYNRLLKQTAETLFDPDAFNVNAFAPDKALYYTAERAELGEMLFHDTRLSGDGSRSCATCHPPSNAFTDGLPKHASLQNPNQLIRRHTPTLLNVALQSNYFYDMRALTLEDQANDVLHNPEEMDAHIQSILVHLKKDSTYQKLFKKAYPEVQTPIDSLHLLNALASYGRSLVKLNSRFDAYMQGDQTALSAAERRGFNLYMGKAKCATCHFMPLFNGIRPPKYVESEAEIIGVPKSLKDSIIDPDNGWYDVVGVNYYRHAFKTPTVRNAAQTAPYMHNGVYPDLESLMEFYNNAGGTGLGLSLWNQTLPEDSLKLTPNEIKDLIAFIKSLNSI